MKKLLCLLSLMLVMLLLAGCGSTAATFSGSRVTNDDQYVLEFSILDRSDTQTMTLSQGDQLDVTIDCGSGDIAVTIQMGDQEPIYRGNQLPSSAFSVGIPKSGEYALTVTGNNAKGKVSIVKASGAQ